MTEAIIVSCIVLAVGVVFYLYGYWSGYAACANDHLSKLAELEESQATLHRVVMEAVKERRRA